jgi:hypothetical protein
MDDIAAAESAQRLGHGHPQGHAPQECGHRQTGSGSVSPYLVGLTLIEIEVESLAQFAAGFEGARHGVGLLRSADRAFGTGFAPVPNTARFLPFPLCLSKAASEVKAYPSPRPKKLMVLLLKVGSDS